MDGFLSLLSLSEISKRQSYFAISFAQMDKDSSTPHFQYGHPLPFIFLIPHCWRAQDFFLPGRRIVV